VFPEHALLGKPAATVFLVNDKMPGKAYFP